MQCDCGLMSFKPPCRDKSAGYKDSNNAMTASGEAGLHTSCLTLHNWWYPPRKTDKSGGEPTRHRVKGTAP